jgi:putative pyruvate formate lyase activating enzyme
VARQLLAAERVGQARALLENCHLCAHHCGVNRLAGKLGLCRAGAVPRCFSAQTEVTDELEIIPTFAIAFSGCDLRCDFCITGAESWYPQTGEAFDPNALASEAVRALEAGARSVMILGGEPTIHLPAVLELIARLPGQARIVWKTNAHGSAQARALLDGLCDVWLADYKFGNDACAQRLAHCRDYLRTVQANLRWAARHSELIVRHLLMPGHLDCCWRSVADWLARELPGVKVSLMGGFWPAWRADWHPELRGTVPIADISRAADIGRELGLTLV